MLSQSDWEAGKPGWVNLWVAESLWQSATSFRDTVAFMAGGSSHLPPEYTLRAEDLGAHCFENVTFAEPGAYRIRAAERAGALSAESNPLIVAPK
jgi:hypothetical protein